MTGREALAFAVQMLREAGIEDPPGDARKLVAFAMELEPGRPNLLLSDDLTLSGETVFYDSVIARKNRVPMSQILGGRWFYNHWFIVTKDVLDPRPDTETLVYQALSEPFEQVLDLGTGSGCILLTLLAENPNATGTGTDISAQAIEVASRNAAALGVEDRLWLTISNWFGAIDGQFDLIVSNPPYITAAEMADLAPEVRDYEPHIALTPGGDGLDAYRAITAEALDHLTPGGRLIVEIGPTQGAAVQALFQTAGLTQIKILPDLDGRDRVVQGTKAT